MTFDENKETLSSTYTKINEEIEKLLMENWDMISSGNYILKDQNGKGSYHRTSDMEALLKGKHIDYSMTIKEFKEFISNCRKE